MPTFLLIGMATPMRVVSRHDTAEAADAAKEAFVGPSNVVEMEGDWPGFTGIDLARVYNSLVSEADRIKRFENRATGLDRVKRLLAPPGTVSLEPQPTAAPPAAQEKAMSKATTKKGRKAAADDDKVVLVLTAKGEKGGKFNEGSARGRVFAAIGSKIALAELVKKCSHFANAAQVRGCVGKLKVNGYVKDE